jgi:hypothetical protein
LRSCWRSYRLVKRSKKPGIFFSFCLKHLPLYTVVLAAGERQKRRG